MIVEITKNDKKLGLKVGQVYSAEAYWLDPLGRVTLKGRLRKSDWKPIGKSMSCEQKRSDVKILPNKNK